MSPSSPLRCQPLAGFLGRTMVLAVVATVPDGLATAAPLEEVVVTASRLSQSNAERAATHLDSAAIQQLAPATITDAVQQLPGVYLSQPGGSGGVAALSIRGGESNFATVLVDGVQVNDPTNTRGGSYDFSTLDVSDVERIELLRGPAAAVHGSDALSGVLNIITRRPTDGGRISLAVGERGYRHTNFGLGSGSEKTAAIGLFASRVRDRNPAAETSFDADTLRVTGHRHWRDARIDGHLSIADVEQQSYPEDSGGSDLAVLRQRDERAAEEWVGSLAYQWRVSADTVLRARASLLRREEQADSPGIAPGPRSPFGVPANQFDTRFDRYEATATAEHQLDTLHVVAGVQLQREDGRSDGLVQFVGPANFSLSRDTASVFVEALTELGSNFSIGGGVRLDKPDGETTETTFNVSADVALTEQLSIFAGVATGFKLPSFFALASPLVGNSNLEPETVRNIEVGVRAGLGNGFELEVAGFRSGYRDLIDFDAATFTNVNRSQATMRGADLSIHASAWQDRLRVRFFASYVDIDLKPEGRLRQRPDWRFGSSLGFAPTDATDVNLRWQRNAERFDSSVPVPASTLDAYERIDLSARWQVTPELRLTLAVDNLADDRYFDAIGVPSLGRRARLGVEFTW
ncbi:MAG: TonB-dependent receptor [Pseudomonadaceae bacterium]|nr:TonB-dependent receptor [Pseudomonadaceae bacterium]